MAQLIYCKHTADLFRCPALQLHSQMLLINSQLEELWYCLQRHVTTPAAAAEDERINYDDFSQARAECLERFGPQAEEYTQAGRFLRFRKDEEGAISVLSFFNYVMRRNAMLQTRVHLSCFDEEGLGSLTETQLEGYISQLVPELPALQGLTSAISLAEYCRIASRKFMFFHARRHRVQIRDLLTSPVLAELMELRHLGSSALVVLCRFSTANAVRVRDLFTSLDEDCNEHLSKQEFFGFCMGTMSQIFQDRVFEEHVAFSRADRRRNVRNEMDMPAFLDFLLAWENRETPQAASYFFKVLDIRGQGYLTQVEIYIFFKAIYRMWVACGQYSELDPLDVKDELFDLVKPRDPLRITLQDLVDCKMASCVISILADVNEFWSYDSRESLMQQDQES
eukprot:jgi/Astpho2/6921/e_gw1.00107.57.1_t